MTLTVVREVRAKGSASPVAQRLASGVDKIAAGFAELQETLFDDGARLAVTTAGDGDGAVRQAGELHLIDDANAIEFSDLREAFEKLEEVTAKKSLLDAYFAQAVVSADAGRIVGSSKPIQYLMQVLGLSRAMAQGRLDQAALLFDDPRTTVDEEKLAALGLDDAEQAEIREQMKSRDHTARAAQQSVVREQTETAVPEHVLAAIRRELKHLLPFALVSPVEIMREAIAEYHDGRGLRDLRAWLAERIWEANTEVDDRALLRGRDAASRRRGLRFSEPDRYGGVRFSGYLDAKRAAVVKAVLGCGTSKADDSTDPRTLAQRRVDKLADLCADVDRYRQTRNGGVSSIIVTTTVAEVENMTGSTLFTTGTGDHLTPADLLALQAGMHDFVALTDNNASLPLALAKGKRSASLYQKLALAATELTCTHPGCAAYWYECDVHHLDPWLAGGVTDIENLTLLCRSHHVDNNDNHDGRNNMGHAERDPVTGRVGHRYANGKFATNESLAANQSSGAKLRRETARGNFGAAHVKNKEGCQNGDHEYFRIMVG